MCARSNKTHHGVHTTCAGDVFFFQKYIKYIIIIILAAGKRRGSEFWPRRPATIYLYLPTYLPIWVCIQI